MPDPTNYIIGQPNPTPFASLQQGYAFGAGIQQDQQQQAQLALQQQVQQQQAQVIRGLISNPNATASDYANAALLVPGLKDQLKQSWDQKNGAQQQTDLSNTSQVYAALQSGNPDTAVQLLTDRAQALRNSGHTADAAHAETMASVIQAHPDFARAQVGLYLSSIPGGDKIVDQARLLRNDPANSKKLAADADLARTNADIAATTAPDKVVEAGLSNDRTLQEIAASKLSGQVAQLNAQIAQANSETERGKLVLERDKLIQQQKQTQFEQGQTVQGSMDAATNALAQVDRVMNHPGLSGGTFGTSAVGTLTGKLSSLIPGTDAADFNATLDTLKSQLFLNNVKSLSGMGALSDAEGKKIADATASLSTNQSAASFKNALGVIRATLQRAQAKAAANPQASTANPTFVLNSPKYGVVGEGQITQLMKAHPGATRAQVIQFLLKPNDDRYLSQGIPPPPDTTPPNPYQPQ